MFCKHCGTTLPDGVKFCPSCGKPTPSNNIPKPVGAAGTGGTSGTGTSAGGSQGTGSSYTGGMKPYPGQPVKVKKTFNIGNYILWAGCAITIISLFLPYCSSVEFLGQKASISLMDPETIEGGMIFLIITAAVAVLNIFKLNIVCIIGSAGNLLLVIAFNSYLKDLMHYASGLVNYSIGHTLLILGGIVMMGGSIAGLVFWTKQKNAALGR